MIDTRYAQFLQQVKQQIQHSQVKVVLAASQQLLISYWQIGGLILKYQQEEGWGAKVIDRLAGEIRHAFPGMSGFSARNLGYMKRFVEASMPLILQQGVAKLPLDEASTSDANLPEQNKDWESRFLSSPLAQISWSHHVILLDKVKEPLERLWYMEQTNRYGWGRNTLRHQIDLKLYHRQVKARKVNNFTQTLPPPQSDLAQQLLKDPYIFDFVTASAQAHERDIENQLVSHVTKFLLELGQGFAFVGRQYPLKVGDSEFAIDLLFYHIRLRCYVVIELKARDFEPGDAGQINFYVNVINDHLRVEGENPTIGLLLCKGKNDTLAKYALSGINNPLGVADYQLTKAVPDNLKSQLPTIESIEQEFAEGTGDHEGE